MNTPGIRRLGGFLVAWHLAVSGAAPPVLFEVAAEPRGAGLAGAAQEGPVVGRDYRLGPDVDPARLKAGDRWGLGWGDRTPSVLVIDDTRTADDGAIRVRGRLEGSPDSVVLLTTVGRHWAGTVWEPGAGLQRILPCGEGRVRVQERDAAEEAVRCANHEAGPVAPLGPDLRRLGAGSVPEPAAGTRVTLDLLFAFTAAAEAGAGGEGPLRALLDLAVAEANDTFERSGARLELRLVDRMRVAEGESGDLATDLGRLLSPTDGRMDEVHARRELLGADVVCLVTEWEETRQYAGMARQLRDTSPGSLAGGFLVCLRPYLIGNYTLPHEVGHVLGGNHDRANAEGGGLDPWSYGTRITVEGQVYRTVMAYRPGLQFPHFSNPEVSFRGVPTGVASGEAAANNVRTLNLTAPLVAAAREPALRVGFAEPVVDAAESGGALRLRLVRVGDAAGTAFTARTIDGSARGGIDFVPFDLRIAGAAGDGAVEELELRLLDNDRVEGTRHLTVALADPTAGLALGPHAAVQVRVRDDELDGAAALDTSFRARPGADHVVTSLALTPRGEVLAGGSFSRYNGHPHPRLVRIRADGEADPGFPADVKYRVQGLAMLSGERVALAGEFNTVNGEHRNHVAVLRADGTLDPTFLFEEGTDGPVHALAALPEGGLYAGGGFTEVHGRRALRVARLRPDGSVDTGFDSRRGPDDDVFAVVPLSGGRVAIGGRFRSVGGVVRGGLAVLRGNGSLDSGWGGMGVDGGVRSVAVDAADRMIVGGDFTRFHGSPAGRIVRITAQGTRDETFQAGDGADDTVETVRVDAVGGVWMGGRFQRVNGVTRVRVARLRPDGAVDEGFDPGLGPNDAVLALEMGWDDTVVIGGMFTEVNGVPRGGVARLWGTRVSPPRMEAVGVGADGRGLAWRARVHIRQAYELEEAADLGSWEAAGPIAVPGDGDQVSGQWDGRGRTRGFLRIRRRLE